jgi:hypothetical protein
MLSRFKMALEAKDFITAGLSSMTKKSKVLLCNGRLLLNVEAIMVAAIGDWKVPA